MEPSESSRVPLSPEAADQRAAEIAPLISQLMDVSYPPRVRRQAARELARIGSDEAMAALRDALRDSPSWLKATIAERLGESPHPDARPMLHELIASKDDPTVRGAIRGLALLGDNEAIHALARVLYDGERPLSVRTEAALALGEIDQASAAQILARAVWEIQDSTVLEHVLEGLGKRPFAETEEFFRAYLDAKNVSSDLRVAALEALANSPGDVAPFLAAYLSDSDPEVRAAAAWALSAAENIADSSLGLTDWLARETSPEVRVRLYQALETQTDTDPRRVLAIVQRETDNAARMAGIEFLAGTLHSAITPEVTQYFTQTAVPELQSLALTSENFQERLKSVLILRRTPTAAAASALQEIARATSEPRIAEAARSTPPAR